MFPVGLKSIFGRKTRNSYFRPKMDHGGQKSIFYQKNRKFNFLTKIGPKILFRGLKSIFGRKLKKSLFGPKMDPGGQK